MGARWAHMWVSHKSKASVQQSWRPSECNGEWVDRREDIDHRDRGDDGHSTIASK